MASSSWEHVRKQLRKGQAFRQNDFIEENFPKFAQQTGYDIKSVVAAGGLNVVFKAVHVKTNVTVALKVTKPFKAFSIDDFDWESACNEFLPGVYLRLGDGRAEHAACCGIPECYHRGFVQTPSGVHAWAAMQLLGKDIYTLSVRGAFVDRSCFLQTANGMLQALRHLHRHKLVHRDVKPANFCYGLSDQDIYAIDFGFTHSIRSPPDSFSGTPEYASYATLRNFLTGPKDDLESLGYAFLEMWRRGDLPWAHVTSSKVVGSVTNGWSDAQLLKVANLREDNWGKLIETKEIPDFLLNWHNYLSGLKWNDKIDYNKLRAILSCSLNERSEDSDDMLEPEE